MALEQMLLTGAFIAIFIAILAVIISVIKFGMDSYREEKEPKTAVIVFLLVFIIIISSIVVSWEYVNTPDAKQKFVLTLEQNETSEIELIIPNLEGEKEYVPIDSYEIVKGEGEISNYQEGEYLRIQTSSKQFKMEYSETAKMFTEYHGEYDFQYDKLNEISDKNHLESMELSYDSDRNITCHLNLIWKDVYEARFLWSSHQYLVEGDAYIEKGTEQMTVFVERETV